MTKLAKAQHHTTKNPETTNSGVSPELQKTMTEIAQTLAIPSNGPLTPDPAIRETALKRLQARRPTRPGLLKALKRPLFEFRVPLYQAMFAMAVLFAAFLVTDRAFLSNPSQDLQFTDPTPTAGPLADTSGVTATAPSDSQKVVQNTLLEHIGIIDTFLAGSARDTL